MRLTLRSEPLDEVVMRVLSAHPELVEKYHHKLSRPQIIGFFVGMVMQATKGRSKLAEVKSLLKQMLEG